MCVFFTEKFCFFFVFMQKVIRINGALNSTYFSHKIFVCCWIFNEKESQQLKLKNVHLKSIIRSFTSPRNCATECLIEVWRLKMKNKKSPIDDTIFTRFLDCNFNRKLFRSIIIGWSFLKSSIITCFHYPACTSVRYLVSTLIRDSFIYNCCGPSAKVLRLHLSNCFA